MSLQFSRLSSTSLRDVIADGKLPDLEYGLLKKQGDKLRWTSADKETLCNVMQIDVLEAKMQHLALEIHVRSFCHSRDVVADHLRQDERFDTKRCILLIGDVGIVPEPWAGLIQPALYLYNRGFNVVNIEVPEYKFSTQRYLKYGPAIFSGALKFLKVCNVCTLACGNGGALFFETLAHYRMVFGPSHLVFNLDCPPGTKKAPFPIARLEEHLRDTTLQFWLVFQDEDDVYSRYEQGTPKRSYEAIASMQVRLEGERRRGRRSLDYDEVLITESLNQSKTVNVKKLPMGRNALVVFSVPVLESVFRFYSAHKPSQTQDNLQGGLVPNMKLFGQIDPNQELAELPAMRFLRLGDTDQEKKDDPMTDIDSSKVVLPELLESAVGENPEPVSSRRTSSTVFNVGPKQNTLTPTFCGGALLQLAADARMRPLPQVGRLALNNC